VENLSSNFWIIPLYLLSNLSFLFNLVCTPCTPLLAMEYTTLGNTDIQISKLCVGCMSFGKAGTMHDWTLDETEKVVKHALETLSSSPRCGRH